MSDWPIEYHDMQRPGNPGMPHWTRQQALAAGRALADAIYAGGDIAETYIAIVIRYYADGPKTNLTPEYLACIERAVKTAHPPLDFDTASCNANDFANCHRAAWLHLANAFAYLVDKCPHLDTGGKYSDWGNPRMVENPTPHRDISRGDEDLVQTDGTDSDRWLFSVHNIPNSEGWFTISTENIPAAPVSR